MADINVLAEEFKSKWEQFIKGCDAVEENGQWDKEEYGEMEVFFESELTSVIIHLIATDGVISENEVEYLNKLFGLDYTLDLLKEAYYNTQEQIDNYFSDNFVNGRDLLKGIDPDLAVTYDELLTSACDIITESDGIAEAELKEVEKFKAELK